MNKQILRAALITIITIGTSYHSLLSAQEREMPAVSVYTESVAYHQVAQSLSLIGKLQSDQSVNVATEVDGKVKSINVQANQQVKTGQLLFQLDDTKAQAAMLEAQAYFFDEQRKLREFTKLVKSNAITQTAVEGQIASVDIARARLKAAQAEVDRHALSAPFAGTIGLIDFSLGKMVGTGSELMTLDNLTQMTLDLQVPERYLSMLSKGMPVSATSRSWPETIFNGQLTATNSRINPDTLNLRVRVLFNNPDNKLKPGMMMSAKIVFPAINAPVIPVQALEYSGTKRYVYIVNKQGMASRQEVILGARIKNQILIEKGVKIGDKIVVQGLVNMRDGLKVEDLSSIEKPDESSKKMQESK
ncbi:Secretion protein HlyD [Psychromonas ingrahamii 37]|uniref:Secretion protein HlyD n=1 Tax=Psychromonas ingrahamii (strain DSM 17664 / CCUG 51855 / 37) TaxID=357804 RepID=A1SS64_PSYIN|nr:efflux RND transporter periplasmic adaptor subunit [Psychromonas ingrahamii]ABM02329.1 Secretion protein HlyD [Psychromonas ingrahamii 37]